MRALQNVQLTLVKWTECLMHWSCYVQCHLISWNVTSPPLNTTHIAVILHIRVIKHINRHFWVGGGFSHSTGFVQSKNEFRGFWLKSDSNFQAQSSFTSSLKLYKSRSTLEIATPFTQWQITHLLPLSFLPSPWCTATITLFCQSRFPPVVKLLGGVMRAWGAE